MTGLPILPARLEHRDDAVQVGLRPGQDRVRFGHVGGGNFPAERAEVFRHLVGIAEPIRAHHPDLLAAQTFA